MFCGGEKDLEAKDPVAVSPNQADKIFPSVEKPAPKAQVTAVAGEGRSKPPPVPEGAPETKDLGSKEGSFLRRKVIQPILQIKDTPQSIALGVTVGIFVALTPTVGLQMTLIVLVGTALNRLTRWRMNRVVGLTMCWVSNPITMIPMYYGYLWLGWILTGRGWMPPLSLSAWQARFTAYIQTTAPTWWDYLQGMFLAGMGELAWPMWIGSLVVAVAVSVPLYLITYRSVERYQLRRRQKKEKAKAKDPAAVSVPLAKAETQP
jgi:uncharacterized protein